MKLWTWIAPAASVLIVVLVLSPTSAGAGPRSHSFGVQSTLFLRSGLLVPGNAQTGQPRPIALAWDPTNGRTYVADASGMVEYFASVQSGVVHQIYVGVRPGGIAVDGPNQRLYVTETALNKLAVFNASTGRLVATVPVGSQPIGVAVDAALGDVLVVNSGSSNLTEVNSTTDRTVGSLPAGPGPLEIAVDTRNGHLFVTDPVGCPTGSTSKCNVTVVNPATGLIVAQVKVGLYPSAVVYDSANNRIYVTATNSHRIAVINASANAVATSIDFSKFGYGVDPNALAVDPGIGALFAADQYEVEEINTTTNAFGLRISHSGWGTPNALAFDFTRNLLLVSDPGGFGSPPYVHTFNPAHNTYGPSVLTASSAGGVAYDSGHGVMYASDGILNRIDKVGAVNRTLFGTVPGETPGAVATDTASNRLFVGHYSSIDVLNDTTYARVAQISDTHGLFALAYDAATGDLWVANQDENVTVYNVATNTTVATIFFNGSLIGYSPQSPTGPNVVTGLAFDPRSNFVYVEVGWWDESSDTGAEQISAFNATTRSIALNWTGYWFGGGMIVDPIHQRLYQIEYDPAYGGSWVNAFNDRNLSLRGTATIYNWNSGSIAWGLGFASSTNDVYVSGQSLTGDLFQIDTANYSVAATLHTGYYPAAIALDPATNRLWVSIVAAGAISILYP